MTAPAQTNTIASGEMYGLDEAKRRLGWKDAAMRSARRNGLEVRYIGGRGYVFGDDVIGHIREHGKSTK